MAELMVDYAVALAAGDLDMIGAILTLAEKDNVLAEKLWKIQVAMGEELERQESAKCI